MPLLFCSALHPPSNVDAETPSLLIRSFFGVALVAACGGSPKPICRLRCASAVERRGGAQFFTPTGGLLPVTPFFEGCNLLLFAS